MTTMTICLRWLPHWKAYAVRRGAEVLGLVVLKDRLPFAAGVTVTFAT